MGEGSASLVWFAAPGFGCSASTRSTARWWSRWRPRTARVACPGCGVFGLPKDRRWVTLRGAPLADRPVTARWRKRVMECCEALCEVRTWTEQRPEFALARAVLTERAGRWATDRIADIEATPTSAGSELGVVWSTVWRHVGNATPGSCRRTGSCRPGCSDRVRRDRDVTAKRLRRRRFVNQRSTCRPVRSSTCSTAATQPISNAGSMNSPPTGSKGSRSCPSIRTRDTARRSSTTTCSPR